MLKKLDFQPIKLTWNKENITFSKTIDRMTIFEWWFLSRHYNDVIMGAIASQIISLTIIYSIVYSDVDQRKHQSSASLAFVQGIHRWPVNSPHKWPVMWNMFPFDDVIMWIRQNTFHMQNTITMMSQCNGARETHWVEIPNLRRISYTCPYDTTFYTNANFEMKNFYNEMLYLFFYLLSKHTVENLLSFIWKAFTPKTDSFPMLFRVASLALWQPFEVNLQVWSEGFWCVCF